MKNEGFNCISQRIKKKVYAFNKFRKQTSYNVLLKIQGNKAENNKKLDI